MILNKYLINKIKSKYPILKRVSNFLLFISISLDKYIIYLLKLKDFLIYNIFKIFIL